jgi:hypothetical protein
MKKNDNAKKKLTGSLQSQEKKHLQKKNVSQC